MKDPLSVHRSKNYCGLHRSADGSAVRTSLATNPLVEMQANEARTRLPQYTPPSLSAV